MSDPYVRRTQEWINSTYGSNPATPDIGPIAADGITGWQTINALVRSLQYELGISTTARSNTFGPGTLAALTAHGIVNNATTNKNLIRIAQGAMYCKGYEGGDGYITGTWVAEAVAGMQLLRGRMGLVAGNGDVVPKVFKALLNMDAFVLLPGGSSAVRTVQQALNGRYLGRKDFMAIPADGRYTGDVQTALVYAMQYEVGLADGVANGNFGPTTKALIAAQANLGIGDTDGTKFFVHLFQAALICNGYTVAFDGYFGEMASLQATNFQSFVALPATGTATMRTWASLLVSTGDADRPGTGADCVMTVSAARLSGLRSAGYTHFGRYLMNTPDNTLDKCIKQGELQRIIASGGRIFPLFQTGGGDIAHFSYDRGVEVGEEAGSAAWAYRLPADTIIYFSVDFDATVAEVITQVIPYFQGLPTRLGRMGREYRVGVYAPRRVCHQLNEAGLVVSAFVSDMSIGYGSNRAQTLPENWAFDQIQTRWEGAGATLIEIDKNIVSGFDDGIGSLAAPWGAGDDPRIVLAEYDDMWDDMFRDTFEHEIPLQQAVNLLNQPIVRARVLQWDEYITDLAAEFNCYKALILTPMVHEGLCFNDGDGLADTAVRAYYLAMELGLPIPPGAKDDSSTGFCQIFARTAIRANNYALAKGLVTGRLYDASVWQDVWDMWKMLDDPAFNLKMAMLVMMMEAGTDMGIEPDETRSMTPSEVQRMCMLYNGTNENAMRYGRNRMSQYFAIQRWEEAFR